MARRPSTTTLSSVNSSGSLPKLSQLPSISQSLSHSSRVSASSSTWLASRTSSGTGKIATSTQLDGPIVDPDELFVKHTVAEVKAIQHKLRADADAKQQELRLMVGERYRDLLQASTSIISLDRSSDNVLHALEEMRSITSVVGNTAALPRVAHSVGQNDAHLHVLQSLSAHVKLLLDAPEHLWRLMERKLYLHAAWLFLLCRVVHRALLREDEDEETSWNSYGLDVVEQFPLIQRQWDVVSQFRTQITHKATLSLREHISSPAAVGASLLSLHLIESRPLPETLSVLLAQRSRTLATLLSRPHDHFVNGDAVPLNGGHNKHPTRLRKAAVRNTQSKLEAALQVVSRTVGVARHLYLGISEQKPLLFEVLSYIQTDSSSSTSSLPPELKLSTQYLLSTLPSSSHFMQLPPNIKSYRPYIDSSVTSSLSAEALRNKLLEWFTRATEDIRLALGKWLFGLHTVTEIWTLRSAILQWTNSAVELEENEKAALVTVLEDACLRRASDVWKEALESASVEFRDRLAAALSALKSSDQSSVFDASPVQYLFQAPSLMRLSQANFKSPLTEEAFDKYRRALKQRISGRTPLLDGVIASLERSTDFLRQDFEAVDDSDTFSSELSSKMQGLFRSDALMFCNSVVDVLEQTVQTLSEQSGPTIQELLFTTRLALQLHLLSRFAQTLRCDEKSIARFRTRSGVVYEQSVARWRRWTVCSVLHTYRPFEHNAAQGNELQTGFKEPRPSPSLVNALLSLSSHIQQLGIPSDSHQGAEWSRSLLDDFIMTALETLTPAGSQSAETSSQVFCDIVFLQAIVKSWKDSMQLAHDRLDTVLKKLQKKLPGEAVNNSAAQMDEVLSRLRMPLAALLPQPISAIHTKAPNRPSSVEPQYQSAVELVKPPPRFGLLLVGSSTVR